MTTEQLNLYNLLIQGSISFLMFVTFIIYWRQLISMKRGVKSQNLLEIVKFLQEPKNRKARSYVLKNLKDKDYKNWDNKDKDFAGVVCSSYGTAGGLLKKQIADPDLIFEGYKDSIMNCHEILDDFVKEKRQEISPDYWINYDWFYENAKNYNKMEMHKLRTL